MPSTDQGPSGGGQPVGPPSAQNYIYPRGSHAVSFHLGQPDCKGKGVYPDQTISLDAGKRAFLFLSSADATTLQSLFVPIQG